MSLDSSIPAHLKCPRTRDRRVNDSWSPPVPAYSARPGEAIQQIVMAYFGVQAKGDDKKGALTAAYQKILATFKLSEGPARHVLVQFVDAEDYLNLIAVAYWIEPARYETWSKSPEVSGWWSSDDRLKEGVGYFREVLSPRMEQFETIYTHAHGPHEGVSILFDEMSEPIFEHGYWGSMRDRLPLSQTDPLEPSGTLKVVSGTPSAGGRVVVQGHENLTLIRSGEDWSLTEGEERETWYNVIEPVLHEGMNYLRDDGREVGCYSNRYCHHIDENGKVLEKGFGYSLWRSVGNLENWGASHHTHLAIYVTFNRMAKTFKNLTLYHEVSVFDSAHQHYEYINCHPKIGLLGAV